MLPEITSSFPSPESLESTTAFPPLPARPVVVFPVLLTGFTTVTDVELLLVVDDEELELLLLLRLVLLVLLELLALLELLVRLVLLVLPELLPPPPLLLLPPPSPILLEELLSPPELSSAINA